MRWARVLGERDSPMAEKAERNDSRSSMFAIGCLRKEVTLRRQAKKIDVDGVLTEIQSNS